MSESSEDEKRAVVPVMEEEVATLNDKEAEVMDSLESGTVGGETNLDTVTEVTENQEPVEEADGEGDDADAPVVEDKDQKGEESTVVTKEQDDDGDKKKKILIALCCCCILIGLIVAMFFLFSPETGGLARAQEDPYTDSPTASTGAPTTAFPTGAPTQFPTKSPTTAKPTASPVTPSPTTAAPTPEPTEPPIIVTGLKSRLSCAEIRVQPNVTEGKFGDNNFQIEKMPDGTEVCGDTFGGFNPDAPNSPRNSWTNKIGRRNCQKFTYDEGSKICDELAGARWCSVAEFRAGIANGTGCGGDSDFIYTSDDCDTPDGESGKVMFDIGLRRNKIGFTRCETNLSTISLARCCGDADNSPDVFF